jgi:hypothetical protein
MSPVSGGLTVRPVTLPDNATEVKHELTPSARNVTIHSRSGFDIQIGFELGSIAAGNYITLESGLYYSFSDQQIGEIYLQSVDIGGDTAEVQESNTTRAPGMTAGPSAGL